MLTKTGSPTRCRAAGVSVLELIAVLAVTGIVGALGLSAYRTYTARAEVASSIAATAGPRERVAAVFRATGLPPADRLAAGLSPARDPAWGDYVGDVDVIDGRVDIRFGPAADEVIAGQVLSITPFETADQQIVWICGNRIPGVGLNPLGFAGGGRQAVQVVTKIEARYLPPSCR